MVNALKQKKQKRLPRGAAYAVLRTVLPDREARFASGLSDRSKSTPNAAISYQAEVQDIRQRLADLPGFVSYLDLLVWFNSVKDDETVDMTNRKDAAKSIVKMQGYDAPLKIEAEAKIRVLSAVVELRQLLGGSNISPEAIAGEIGRRKGIGQQASPVAVLTHKDL